MIHLVENSGKQSADKRVLELTPRVFAKDGWLHRALNLQHRPQQAAFAVAAASAFATGTPLLCEAGTGVGKSLAYLIPGIIHAMDTVRQFVVTTHTIPLQEQIQGNDLTKCLALFENIPELKRYAKFKTALLVGKANYLCTTRLAKAIHQHTELLEGTQQRELRTLQEWAATTETGLREELQSAISPEVWDWVNAESSLCNTRNCSPQNCPYQRARTRLAEANIIIVNHALLLSLIAAGASPKKGVRGILFPNDFAVLDEAHCLPDVATDHLGKRVTAYALERMLKMLWNPKTNRGLLAAHDKRVEQRLITEVLLESEFFFNDIQTRFLEHSSIRRLREAGWIEPRLNEPLHKLTLRLGELAKDETDRNRRDELADFKRRIDACNTALNDIIVLGNAPEHVYWVERTGVRGKNVSANSAPLDVAAELRKHLFERETSVVLTSATLTDGVDMSRFRKRVGAAEVTGLVEASPFDYQRNMEIYIAADAPAIVHKDGTNDIEWLSKMAEHCIRLVPGGTLLLCTSHGDVKRLHEHLSKAFSPNRRVLAQLVGTSRSRLVQEFREAQSAVLIGTDSFWTGVDVPGPALLQVIITRLPFENPSHPIVEARTEWISQQGKSPFAEMSLPAALIKFRQGLGRLIRKIDDRGRLVILDSRMLTKTYGRHFVSALPHSSFVRFTKDTLFAKLPVYQ
ncbi:MAG: ATP-dependent DNA helicase [Puniceicoccales bacterium]|jgi:ATP-dependent DNA helicase DinG|nr:ATP-dependent DNA helicase [Puniceicoccales bacterium]